jgi:hypothetical protein
MKQIMDQLRELEPGYYPNPEVCDELSNVNLAPMIGPAGTGKTTLLDYVVENYQDFGSSVGFTTRLPRDYESLDAYTFYDHSQETLERILGEVQDHRLVQFAVHPYTDFIYGSEIDSYKSQYNLIDIMASAVEPMRSLPFKSMNEIAVVCGVDDWQARFAPRLSDPDDAAKRIAEGVSSLEWFTRSRHGYRMVRHF